MRTGVSFPGYGAEATFAMASGSAHADYPVTNLADLKKIRTPFRASASGAIAVSFVLPEAAPVEFVGLCHHNATDGATYRIRLYSDESLSSEVYDSGTLAFDIAAGGLFAKVTPHVLTATSPEVRSGRIDLSDTGSAWEIGGVEVAGFWDLTDPAKLDRGIAPKDLVLRAVDGAGRGMRQFAPRTVEVGLEAIDWTLEGATLIDFQAQRKRSEPFVYVRDYDDAATWGREAMLVRNAALPALSKREVYFGDLSLKLVEHLR